MKSLRDRLTDPEYSPMAILTELAVEGTSSFVEAQRILLNLAQHEADIVMGGVKERVSSSVPATATVNLVAGTMDTFIAMQQEFLKITSKQTMDWLEQVANGKYTGTHFVDLTRDAMDNFVHAQKKFLDLIAKETTLLTNGNGHAKVVKKTELAKLAREASDAFIEMQKKLLDVAGQQMNVDLKAANRTIEMMKQFRLLPMANFTGEGVKKFVDAEKALIDSMIKPRTATTKRVTRPRKTATAHAHAAHAHAAA
jgi:disulfide oxidoreductase YuzD